MVSSQDFQPCHVYVQIHFLFNQRVPRTERFDLSVGKSLFIHILTGTNRAFTRHNLADEPLFILQCLEQISIKCSLCHVIIDLYFFVPVSLPDDTAVPLRHIGRTPSHIKMMNCN